MTTQDILNRIKKFSLFKEIADEGEKLSVIASIMQPRTYKQGERIMEEGDLGDELYLLTKGAVRVVKNTKQGEEYTIVDLKAEFNVFFGEIALMDADKRSASILCLEDSEVLVIRRDDYERLGKEHPAIILPITQTIIKIICARLRNVNNDVILLFDALVNEIQTTAL